MNARPLAVQNTLLSWKTWKIIIIIYSDPTPIYRIVYTIFPFTTFSCAGIQKKLRISLASHTTHRLYFSKFRPAVARTKFRLPLVKLPSLFRTALVASIAPWFFLRSGAASFPSRKNRWRRGKIPARYALVCVCVCVLQAPSECGASTWAALRWGKERSSFSSSRPDRILEYGVVKIAGAEYLNECDLFFCFILSGL